MSVFRLLRSCARPLFALLLIVSISACGSSSKIQPGVYRAVIELSGGELPFTLELTENAGQWTAFLINGSQRERVGVSVEGRKLEMKMPGYANRIEARMRGGKLSGKFHLLKRGGEKADLPFKATLGESWRFNKEPLTDNADFTGRWRVTFTSPDGSKIPAVGEFKQKFHEVTGTFLTTTGDYGFLAGEVRDEELLLSTFDGARAYLLKAKLARDGSLQGTWWTGSGLRLEMTAERDNSAKLEDPDSMVRFADDTWTLGFTYPDETGKPISLADGRFKDKVVVISLMGSWCPNSHDATAYLAPLYQAQRERGVEVVALMFEYSADREEASQAVKTLRDAYQVEFPTLIAGTHEKAKAAEQLPQLSGVHAYPTFLFIDRKGRVRRIYSGFAGPATGEHHEQMTESLGQTLDTLVAEQAVGGALPETPKEK